MRRSCISPSTVIGRHSDSDGRVECTLCGAECEHVVHVLWGSYSTCMDHFQEALKLLLGAIYTTKNAALK